MKKRTKKHSSTTDTAGHKNANITTKDAEAEWMDAVMTATFVTASMKSASENESVGHDSDTGGDSSDSSN
ncbi:hypothetical protein KFD70_06920 [Bacillus pfraonensis]|nr:hypothetical protein [Bacillus pseudomycoides]HEK9104374.1 hypothetical protein [Bacillus pseudomycoides]